MQDRGLDVLVNNAGIYNKVSLDAGAPELILENVAVNAVAPFQLTRALLPLLRQAVKSQTGGSKVVIANITSKMGSIADNTSGGHYAYRTSKVRHSCEGSVTLSSSSCALTAPFPHASLSHSGGNEHDLQESGR